MNDGGSHPWWDVTLVYHMSWLSPWKADTLVFGGRKVKVQIPVLPITSWVMGGLIILLGDDHCYKPYTQIIVLNLHNRQPGRYHSSGFTGR